MRGPSNLLWCPRALDAETFNLLRETVSNFVTERLFPRETEVAETDANPADIIQDMRDLGLGARSFVSGRS
jgi:hypothetical protein